MRGLYFKVALNKTIIAFKFTIDLGMDLSAHEDFVARFATAVLQLSKNLSIDDVNLDYRRAGSSSLYLYTKVPLFSRRRFRLIKPFIH